VPTALYLQDAHTFADAIDHVRYAEERGFDTFYVPEHTHIPLSRLTPHPLGKLQEYYKRTLDPFGALTAAATTTTTLLVGPGVCLVRQNDPILLAKQVATLDRLSGGRFLFGVGAGWNVDEMQNHGTDPSTRFAPVPYPHLALQTISSQDVSVFPGAYEDNNPSGSRPTAA